MDDILQQKINEHGSLRAYYAWLDRPPTSYGTELDDAKDERLEAEDREREAQMFREIEEEQRLYPERFEPNDDWKQPAPAAPITNDHMADEDDDLPDFLRPSYLQKK